MHQVQRGIFYEDSFLGVTLGGLVFPHGTILIDAPLRAEDARSWRSALLNQRGGATRMLVNLDSHPDRTLGDRALDTTIVAHQKTAQVFRHRPTIFKGQTVETGAIWETYGDAVGMRWATPDITFTDRMSLYWGGPEVILEHHPGPGPGAIWAIIPSEKVIFIGDLVVLNQPPFLANAEITAWLESLNLIETTYAGYTLLSGRGGQVDPEDLSAEKQFLQAVHERLEGLAQQNAPAEATHELLPNLVSRFSGLPEQRAMFEQRLRYGLYQYYNRRYRSVPGPEESEEEPNE